MCLKKIGMKNKIQLKSLCSAFVIGVICTVNLMGQKNTVRTDFIEIGYNEKMHRSMQWLSQKEGMLVASNPLFQESVSMGGVLIRDFTIAKEGLRSNTVNDPEFGRSKKAVIEGVYQQNGLNISRRTTILLPNAFPNTAIFQTTYTNLGKKSVKIDSVYIQRLALKPTHQNISNTPYPLVSFQGGVPAWGEDYAVIPLELNFERKNFQGIHEANPGEFIGGGIPLVDVWGKQMGIAVCHLSKRPEWVSLPVRVDANGTVDMGITEVPEERLGMLGQLEHGESYTGAMNAVIFHQLDYFDALGTYSNLLRSRGVAIPEQSPEGAHDPYWKSWGFGLDFTLEGIYGILPELKEIGVQVANLDDGWFDYYGDWHTNRSDGKFPNGEADMLRFVERLHKEGFKTNLWWYPLGVSPESNLAKDHADYLVMDVEGNYIKDSRELYQLCPAFQPALDHIQNLVVRFIDEWGYDGLYSDTRGLSSVPPCFNPAHDHKRPLDSFEEIPKMYQVINTTLKNLNKDALHEVCICAAPHSPYNMPYYDIANASDPINLVQTRRRIKVEKALHGPSYAVGDCYQVPDDEWSGYSVPQSFESALGTGAQATTFYTDLDPVQKDLWKRWFHTYNNMELSSAQYLNLYDIALDKPEAHVVQKEKVLYYGFFAELWSKEDPLELRGLEPGITYSVYDYGNGRDLGEVKGSEPVIHVGFRDNLLLELKPLKTINQ